MTDLRIQQADTEARLQDWRHVHNVIIPTASSVLSLDEVRERAGRNQLAVAYRGDVLVGCSTVRPPTDENGSTATVIARILPELREQGLGGQLYAHGLAAARKLGARVIETVVLEANREGLRFARSHGFVEIERYVLPGDDVAFIDLRLA
ncbi:GNAT family N-acetyltransferase [Streptomyces sp. NPDC050738]|uniref:GNAT family N-acetyltransferase n=1 Tax=Streptomyces sp. NPDC050738 TaxID=3154744 RepID=UPI00344520E8